MLDLARRAGTPVHIRIAPAGTGIHCCHQHKICRKQVAPLAPGDPHLPVLQGLPQDLQDTFLKFREFI